MKLEAAEVKLHDLKSNMATMGKEAAAAMAAVEAQQQRLTLQRLIAMVRRILSRLWWFFGFIWIYFGTRMLKFMMSFYPGL